VKSAIRKRLPDFAAILVLFLIAMGVATYILSHQRLNLPAWVPIVGKDFFTLKAEFQTGQALTPGQGQTVDIAGVKVGEIQKVELVNGRALVTMKIEPKYADGTDGRPAIYRNARMLLRPKTGLKDMIIELSTGTPSAGKVPDGGTIPVGNTLPDINPDEILASLDADTRQFLQILLNGAGTGLKGRAGDLSSTFRRFEPTARDTLQITDLLAQRRQNIARSINSFRKLAEELGARDDQLAEFVSNSNAVFQAFASQEANIRATLAELPPTLTQAQTTLADTTQLANALGPTLNALLPTARALGPTQLALQPFLKQTTPIIENQLRPFTKIATPIIANLQPATKDLTKLTPDLIKTFDVVNYLLNELAYNPPGDDEGYLFYVAWANHIGKAIFGAGDAQGPIRRGEFLASCSSLELLNQVVATTPQLAVLTRLLNPPATSAVCPTSTGASRSTTPTAGAAGKKADDPADDGLGPAGEGPNAAPGTSTEPRSTTPAPVSDKPAPEAGAPSTDGTDTTASSTTPTAGAGG
jgi:phospholipid/cholesterol/gamma-HCH transport system substrate-binding protein